ncbi:28S ribosomal protein S16, mitochondrial-like [Anneissia japonica]|uniref:28S ribosomal protein S16, mitochondrial-like n=1 Tax=Anneissia japonica TaxID=1529436 RepID=UPI001425B6F0|nr:28S ribosomal protein S16, mitochondrial-like [Anneissia japonica]
MPKIYRNPRVMIRLARHGCANRPFYHIVAILNRRARDSEAFFEQLGTYDPMPNDHNEKLVSFNFDRLKYWLAKGAEPTKPVAMLLGYSGFLPLHPMSVVLARRARQREQQLLAAASEQQSKESELTS